MRFSVNICQELFIIYIFWKVMLYLFRKMREIYEAKCTKQT